MSRWHHVLRLFAGVVLACLGAASHAAAPVDYFMVHWEGKWYGSKDAACGAALAAKPAGIDATSYVIRDSVYCVLLNKGDDALSGLFQVSKRCSSTAVPVDGQCPDNQACTDGSRLTVNLTMGYAASPATGANRTMVIDGLADNIAKTRSACVDGCVVNFPMSGESDFGKAWVAQVPGPNGLYRNSQDVYGNNTGGTCSASDDSPDAPALNPGKPPPPCPGTLGSVNGVSVCLSNSKPTGVDPFRGGTDAGPDTRGNPAAGKAPKDTKDEDRAGGPGASGNGGANVGGPIVGANNSDSGKGCNDGSNKNTLPCKGAGRLDADGTTTKPTEGKEQQNCGAPGQPKCGIDETGTPDGKGKGDDLKSAVDKDGADSKQRIEEAGKLEAPPWTWGFQLPAGCAPLVLPAFEGMVIDVCQWQGIVHDLMSMIWLAVTVWCCIGMVGRTVQTS